MNDPVGTPQAGDPTGGTPQAGNPPQPPPNPAPPATDPQDVSQLPEWAQKLIKDTRQEAANHRVKLNDFEAADKARKDAELDELTRTKNDLAEAQRQAHEAVAKAKVLTAKNAFFAAAHTLGIVNAEAAFKLLDDDALTFDQESGEVTNAEEAAKKLTAKMPFLLGSTTSTANPAKGAGSDLPQRSAPLTGADAMFGRRL